MVEGPLLTSPPQVWAWVIGSLCGILATLNPHATAFRNTMDELNYFMHAAYHPCIPPDLPWTRPTPYARAPIQGPSPLKHL